MQDQTNAILSGFLKIYDPIDNTVFVEKQNAIHFENCSEALASMVANKNTGRLHEMHFGNGGTSVDPTGVITYLPSNNTGASADLYNPTYYKVVDDTSSLNTDPTRNRIEVRHVPGQVYTDLLISCLLDYGEPAGQTAFDNTTDFNGDFVFDELGLKSWTGAAGTGKLLTHVVFHPLAKSLNRLIQIDYTVRLQTLSQLGSIT